MELNPCYLFNHVFSYYWQVCMCTSGLCNDNDYDIHTERPTNNLLRKQFGQQQHLSSSIAEGEIGNNYTNVVNNDSTPDRSSKHSTPSILFLHPLFSKKQHTLPSHQTNLSLITNTQNNSIETLYVDTPVKALGTQNDMLNKDLGTPREEAFLDEIEEDDSPFEDLSFQAYDEDVDHLDSIVPKHRVPRQAQGEQPYIRNLFFMDTNVLYML